MPRAPRPRFLDNTGLGDFAWFLGGAAVVVTLIWLVIGVIRLIDLPPVPAPPAAVPGHGGGR